MTFNDYRFEPQVTKGLEKLQFSNPTPIQQQSIPLILKGKDIMGCAQTGSGKTGAFGIPFFSKLIQDPEATLLVLTPTRELAQQVSDFLKLLSQFENSITVATLVGGMEIRRQLKALRRNPRIVVGTPGRVTDHLKRGTLSLAFTKYLVLDEGDRMLDMGFAPQLDKILEYLPQEKQTCLFTATLSPKVKSLAKKYLSHPEHIQVGPISKPVENIHQQVIEVDEKAKQELILDQLNQRSGSIIVFLKTKRRTNHLYKHLKDYAHKVDFIHGDRTQSQRNSALKRFRLGESRILCATDVAARGLDIPEVEHVINFDLPVMKEDYLHRIGRTARNGAKGEAVSFVAPQERREWNSLVKQFKIAGAELAKPSHEKREKSKPHKAKNEKKAYSTKRQDVPREESEDRSSQDRRSTKKKFKKNKKRFSFKSNENSSKSSSKKKSKSQGSSKKKWGSGGSSWAGGKTKRKSSNKSRRAHLG